jgi:gluconate 2-dehydrogenase gamma chain
METAGTGAAQPQRLLHFSTAQGAELEAMTARIIPSDDSPGAREAGVVYFIDQGMRTFAKDQAKNFDEGLAAVSKAVARKHKGQTRFSALTPAQQDEILRGMERTQFFGALRFATIAGFLALPKYGDRSSRQGRRIRRRPKSISSWSVRGPPAHRWRASSRAMASTS